MNKPILARPGVLLLLFILSLQGLSAQTPTTIIDSAVRTLTEELGRTLSREQVLRVSLNPPSYRGNETPLGEYWYNQLLTALVNYPNRGFTVLPRGSSADVSVSAEIIETPETLVVFTFLIRNSDGAILGAHQTELDRTISVQQMLIPGSTLAFTSNWDFPIPLEVGSDEDGPGLSMTLLAGTEEYFVLVPPGNGRLIIETIGDTDTYLELFEADTGDFLGEDDDSGSGRNARIMYNVLGGRRYMAIVSGFNSSTTGDYELRAYLLDLRSDNSWDNPLSFTIGENASVSSVSRHLMGGDEDFFLLVPTVGSWLIAETTGSTDTFMELYDAHTGQLLLSNDDGGAGLNARIRYSVTAGHSYIAKVRGFGSWTSGDYNFRAYYHHVDSDNDWDRPLVYPLGWDSNPPLVERRLIEESEDYFFLAPSEDGWLIAETTGNTDTYMELYDAETRRLLSSNDDGGINLNARIRYTLQGGREYIAMVRGYGPWITGDYSFRAHMSPFYTFSPDEYEPNDDPDTATWIDIGEVQIHNFHHGDDVDWLRFEVKEAGYYVIHVEGLHSNTLDTFIELYDSNLRFIAEDDDGGDFRDSWLDLFLEEGTYYLKIWCLSDEPDQPYTVVIEWEYF